jgi:hypothetical protein
MRHFILAAALMPLACTAFAQTSSGSMGSPAAPTPYSASSAVGGTGGTGWTVRPPDPNNCGTPDAPARCSGHAAGGSGHAVKAPLAHPKHKTS